jgi:hypothetical protein
MLLPIAACMQFFWLQPTHPPLPLCATHNTLIYLATELKSKHAFRMTFGPQIHTRFSFESSLFPPRGQLPRCSSQPSTPSPPTLQVYHHHDDP